MTIMNRKLWKVFAGVCSVVAISAVWALPACAQIAEVKEKPPMYSYVAYWNIPRAQWADMAKAGAANQKILDKAIASGTLVGYGNDENLIHSADGPTHDSWWSATSMAGVLNVLDQFYSSGTWKDLYTHGASYKLKADAPNDAVDALSKNLIVPLMEKMLADGTIHEYEVDVEAIHTEAPGTFWVFYLAANAEGLDKVSTALRDTLKASPLNGPAFGSMTDGSEHRDYLSRTNATYK
jgi:hypothetical protein